MRILQKLSKIKQFFFRPPVLLKSEAKNKYFIFTEVYECGKIGKIALESCALHHPNVVVNIFGKPSDFEHILKNPNFIFHDISGETEIIENFKSGHLGTASLWAKIILERSEKYIIHFDSDVVFRGQVFQEIIDRLASGHSLVGPIRNYQHNPNEKNNVRYLADVTQTYCFGFDREKITRRNYSVLTKMCRGTYNPYGHPVIDFFDPVMFDILRNGGTAYFLNADKYGGCDIYGKRANKYPMANIMIDFGDKIAHFAAVGSGMYYYHHQKDIQKKIASTYIKYALEKYAVYCQIFYKEKIDILYDASQYQSLFEIGNWFGINK